MEPQGQDPAKIVVLRNFVAGVYGPKTVGGSSDGSANPSFVLVRLGVSPMPLMSGPGDAPTRVVPLGLNREAALALAEQLRKCAEMLPPKP